MRLYFPVFQDEGPSALSHQTAQDVLFYYRGCKRHFDERDSGGDTVWWGQCFTPERAQGRGGVCLRQALKDVPLRPMAAGSWSRNSGLAVGELIFSFSLRPLEFALVSVLSGWRMALVLFLEVCCLVWGPTLISDITRCSSRCQMKWRLFSLSTRHSEGAGFVLHRSFQLALV